MLSIVLTVTVKGVERERSSVGVVVEMWMEIDGGACEGLSEAMLSRLGICVLQRICRKSKGGEREMFE